MILFDRNRTGKIESCAKIFARKGKKMRNKRGYGGRKYSGTMKWTIEYGRMF